MSEQEPTSAFIAKHWDYEKTREQNLHIIRRVWKEIHEGVKERRKHVEVVPSPPIHHIPSPEYHHKIKHKRIYSHTPVPSPVHYMMGGEATPEEIVEDEKRKRALNHWELLRRGVFWQTGAPSYNIGRKGKQL